MIKILKWIIPAITFIILMVTQATAQIEGVWLNEEKDAKIEIYQGKDKLYYGKIIWLKNPKDDNGQAKVDKKNPDKSKRNQALLGSLILKGFKKDTENSMSDGTIYDPKSGKTYDCNIKLEKNNTLSIRGYVGISLIGRTTKWTRSTK